MQNKSVTDETLRILNEIKLKGYIGSDIVGMYCKKMDYALNEFFKQPSIVSQDALACMDQLSEISKKTTTFLSLFSDTMMDLYDHAITDDLHTQKQAETKLLYFFSRVSPSTIEQKNRLLTQIQKMPDWRSRKKEVAKVVGSLVYHYEQNGQFNEDPELSVMKSVSDMLHEVASSHKGKRNYNGVREMNESFLNCATAVKTHTPELYEDFWLEKFTSKPRYTHNVPDIKEAVLTPSSTHHSWNINFSRAWDRE